MMKRMPFKTRRGVTLAELMVAMAVLTIGVLAGMGSFKYITQAISESRLKTIATNLAQEKMEVLKNKPYFTLLVTTSPATSVGYNPNFTYDTGNYPPEILSLWKGAVFTRAVQVDYASVSGTSVSLVPYTSSDTGMKKITVYVYWTERGQAKKVQLESYYENPSVAVLNTGFKGHVTNSISGANLSGAIITVIGKPKWRGTSDATGNYSFQVAPGSYSLICSTPGFTSKNTGMLSVTEGPYTPQDFPLTPIATGTIAASSIYAINPSLVISQVVSSTITPNGGAGYDTQFVELFNPTTAQIPIAASVGTAQPHSIRLNITSTCGTHRECDDIQLTYVSSYAAAGGYYLIANTVSFVAGGLVYKADAYYTDNAGLSGICSPTPPPGSDWSPPTIRRIIQADHNGAVWLTDSSGNTLDAVGWNHHANPAPPQCESSCIKFNPGDPSGLVQGDQIVRFSSACATGSTYGRAYDSDDNPNNFYYDGGSNPGLLYTLFNQATGTQSSMSGRPAAGAHVFADDGNSPAVLSSSSSVTGPQGQTCLFSSFTLVSVATGTWTVEAYSASSSQAVANVTVAQGATTLIASATTIPIWPAVGFNHVKLLGSYSGGFASGFVYGAGPNYLVPINGILVGSASGTNTRTDAKGFYVLTLSTGTTVITANYNSDSPNYTTSDATVSILPSVETAVPDFHLAQGGFIKGYVTPGTGALPNIAVQATQGGPIYEDTTDNTGYFYIFVATSASAYTVAPELDPLQSYTSLPSNPLTAIVTVPGSTVFAGTITVIGAMGTITGAVSANSNPITTGVLIVASTGTILNPPASVVASSAPAQAIFYSVSSQADGTYSLDVRASTTTTYNMRAFYPLVDIKTGAVSFPASSHNTQSGVSVNAGATVPNKNFSWP